MVFLLSLGLCLPGSAHSHLFLVVLLRLLEEAGGELRHVRVNCGRIRLDATIVVSAPHLGIAVTKSCMDVDEGNSECGAHQRRVDCQDEAGCVWEGQRCVKGEAKNCNSLNKKQCKRSDSCQWKRKEKLCMDYRAKLNFFQ